MTAQLDSISFSVARRGYDRSEVDDRIAALVAELTASAAARDAAVAEARTLTRQLEASRSETQTLRAAADGARADRDTLRAQVAELSTIPSTVDGMSERLQQMVRIAQDEVNDMRTRATTSAAHVLALAQAEADELRERSDVERREFESERRLAEESLRAQLEESRSRLDKLRDESEGQQARLAAELADHRLRVEAEFATEMDGRRAALLEDLGSLEARQRAEAGRIVEMASQDARQRIEDATAEAHGIRAGARGDVEAAHRELEGLRDLQHQVAEQLTSVRALLDWTLPQMGGIARGDGRAPAAPRPQVGPPVPPAVLGVPTPREPGPTTPNDADGPTGDGADDRGDADAQPDGSTDDASPDAPHDAPHDDVPDRGAAGPRPTPAARHALAPVPNGQARARR
jgi:cell division septum initiation protein DivIVA